jgi:2-oxoglutarate/2-oxoacid ferredoxin oxidoreductase subunit beta
MPNGKTTLEELRQPTHKNTWCPGCGNFGILSSLQKAIVEMNLNPKDTVIVSGIGCSSKLPHYLKTYAFETLHGRSLPVASGIKLANPKMTVIIAGGDGDGYGIGSAHLIHTARRNIDVCYITHDNEIYGLTKGQYSPTTKQGYISPTSPHGAIEVPLNPLALAIIAGATFVARGYANDIPRLTALIKEGVQHKGFALIDVMQPCVTWRKDLSYEFFKNNTYEPKNLNTSDKAAAIKFLLDDAKGDKIAVGVFYKEQRPTYEDGLKVTDKKPVVKQNIDNIDVSKLLAQLE